MSYATSVSLSLPDATEPPRARVFTYPTRLPIGQVDLDQGRVSLISDNPADLLAVAEACTDAARQLADALDREATKAMSGGAA